MSNVPMKWTYHVMCADALLNKYRFSGDERDRASADKLLADSATQARAYEDTAEIAGLVRLQKSVPPPSTGPAPAPVDTGK